jgi:hypothetical protein
MRLTILGLAVSLPLASLAAVLSLVSLERVAQADPPPPYSVSTTGGTLTVTAATGYHINSEYPWKVCAGGLATAPCPTPLADKSKFTIAATTATLPGAPKGTNTLKGAYCAVDSSGKPGSCTPFTTTVTVQ